MKSVLVICVLVGFQLFRICNTQILEKGACNRNMATVQGFEPTRYLGRWYENQKYPFIFELGGKCVYAEYTSTNNDVISVYNLNINQLTGKPNGIHGSARIVGDGKLKVKFDNMPAFIGEADYWVLDTDYDNYAVVYSCTDIAGLTNAKVIWILTREREPQSQLIERARSVIEQRGLSLAHLYKTDQSGC